jgi:SAM-dependent methyltransferase
MAVKTCIVCGARFFEPELLTLDGMPASAQNIPQKKELDDDKALSLSLCQCSGCGLVQFNCSPVPYYKDVIRAGGYSTTMVELRKRQYQHFIDTYNLYQKKIVEIGAGQGEFLSILKEFEVKAFGIEHNAELVKIGRNNSLVIQQGFAGNEETKFDDAPFDAFVSFNYLEHQPKPNDMLRCIFENSSDDAVGLVTVPSFEYIKQYDGYYELIRDHIAYYTFDTLEILFEKNGFAVLEKEIVNRDTLSIIVQKKKRDVSAIVESYTSLPREINQVIDSYKKENKKIAIWGASHQGFTIMSTANLSGKIEYIIDSALFKQGKYAPASHVPIVSPDYYFEHKVDVIIIIAPGYTDEIEKIIRERYGNLTVYSLSFGRLNIISS